MARIYFFDTRRRSKVLGKLLNQPQKFIPVGRTSRIVWGATEIQIQTEYAPRPEPRITSTVFLAGQTLGRVDIELEEIIQDQSEMEQVGRLIARQHVKTLKTIEQFESKSEKKSSIEQITQALEKLSSEHLANSQKFLSEPKSETSNRQKALSASSKVSFGNIRLSESDRVRALKRTTLERLYTVDGVDSVITLGPDGEFLSEKGSAEFKKKFRSLVKQVSALLAIFPQRVGSKGREEGIYEVEPRRLYMVSHCGFIYFLIMKRIPSDRPIEEVINAALRA